MKRSVFAFCALWSYWRKFINRLAMAESCHLKAWDMSE